jgi:hypothetical protein
MPIFEITQTEIRTITPTTFAAAGVRERADLQRLLRSQIGVISPDTLVLAEEFCDWDDSKRRIDLLGIDHDANLIVIELKRTEDGGHMELQSIRYAAMVSTMTFEKVVEIHEAYLRNLGKSDDARSSILEFLGWQAPDEDAFAQDVRIVLASAEFSKEVTTAVLWLNDRGLDIRCVRMVPYDDGGRIFVHVREKGQRSRQDRAERYSIRKEFWRGLLARAAPRCGSHAGIAPGEHYWVSAGIGLSGLALSYVIRQDEGSVELYIDHGNQIENKRIFDWLVSRKTDIERTFGGALSWQRLDDKRASRIAYTATTVGGWKSDQSKWPEIQESMIDGMVRFEKALKPQVGELRREVVGV